MSAVGGGWMAEQVSWLYSPSVGAGEAATSNGAGNATGTINYNRTGISFANTATGTVDFELHAGRSYGGAGCDNTYNLVEPGWTIVVYHSLAPTCPAPTALTATNLTSNTSDLSWTAGGSETSWELEYGATGFAPGSGSTVITSSNPYTLASLSGSTSYDYYVRGVCGVGDTSSPVGPFSFATACAIVSSFPYPQTFDALTPNNASMSGCQAGDNITDCWFNDPANTNNWVARSTATQSTGTGPSADHTGGGNYAFLETSLCYGVTSYLHSVRMDISALTNPEMSFWYHMYGSDMGSLSVEISTNGGATWSESLWSRSGDQGDLWRRGVISLSPYAGTTDVMFRFTGIQSFASYESDIAIDDFLITNDTTCIVDEYPYEETFDGLASYNGLVSGCQSNDNITNCWTNTSANTNNWIARSLATMTTGTGPSGDYTGGGNYVYLEASGCNSNTSYLVSPTMDLSSIASPQMSFWYHMNGSDIGSLGVETSTDGGNNWSTLIWTVVGNQGDQWSQAFINLLSYSGSSNFMVRFVGTTGPDYLSDIAIDDFQINSCSEPSGLLVSNVSGNSADLTWAPGGSESSWEIEYRPTCNTPGAGGTVIAATNQYTLTDLIGLTSYECYVRAICVAGDTSNVVGPVPFTTSYTQSSPTDVITACDSYTWIDGVTYTASNDSAMHILPNSLGCDSIVTLNLTINYSQTVTNVVTACDSYNWYGVTYTESNNTATNVFPGALGGCDLILALDLTINNSTSATDVVNTCDSYTWIDGVTYTTSNNTAIHTTDNAAGCDSIVTLDLTVITQWSGAVSSEWDNPANWCSNSVPGPTDDATIGVVTNNPHIVLASPGITVNNLTILYRSSVEKMGIKLPG
jgi:hypothetical protein